MVNSSYFKKNELKAQFLLNNSEKKVPRPHFVGLINQTPTFSVDFRIFTSPCHCEERSDTAPDLVGWGQTFDSLGQNPFFNKKGAGYFFRVIARSEEDSFVLLGGGEERRDVGLIHQAPTIPRNYFIA